MSTTETRPRRSADVRRTVGAREQPPPPSRIPPSFLPAVALLITLIALAAMMLGVFSVQHVEVVGTGLPVQSILKVADVTGKNIVRLRSDAVVTRLQALPSIEVTRVRTVFPNTVTIYARRRVPYLAWQAGAQTYLVDATGRLLGPTGTTTLPVLAGPARSNPPGFAVLQAARYAAGVVASSPDGTVQRLEVDPALGLVIVGKSGWRAIIGTGDPQALVNRVAELSSVLKSIRNGGQRLKFADFRYRGSYYRLR